MYSLRRKPSLSASIWCRIAYFRQEIGSLSNDDGDSDANGNENGKKATIAWRTNNFASASRFFVHFFAVAARLQRESA